MTTITAGGRQIALNCGGAFHRPYDDDELALHPDRERILATVDAALSGAAKGQQIDRAVPDPIRSLGVGATYVAIDKDGKAHLRDAAGRWQARHLDTLLKDLVR